jgi:hypothetical protein
MVQPIFQDAPDFAGWGKCEFVPESKPTVTDYARRENLLPTAWKTSNTQSVLGGALLGQKKNDDAGPLLQKGYE